MSLIPLFGRQRQADPWFLVQLGGQNKFWDTQGYTEKNLSQEIKRKKGRREVRRKRGRKERKRKKILQEVNVWICTGQPHHLNFITGTHTGKREESTPASYPLPFTHALQYTTSPDTIEILTKKFTSESHLLI